MVLCGSQLGKRQCSILSLISPQFTWFALDLNFFFLLKLRSGRVIRVFKPLTHYPDRIVGFPERRNRIRLAKGFRPTRWASSRSDSGGLIRSWTRWTALIMSAPIQYVVPSSKQWTNGAALVWVIELDGLGSFLFFSFFLQKFWKYISHLSKIPLRFLLFLTFNLIWL